MSKAIYIAATEPDSGKSLVSLGLLRMMLTKSSKVGYFKPILNENSKSSFDEETNTALNFFKLNLDYKDCYAFKQGEVVQLLSEGKIDTVIQTVIEKYKQLEKRFDYVLVEGSDFSSIGAFTELDVNLMFAKNLNIPALIVGSGNGKKTDEIVHSLQLSYKSFRKKEVDVIGIIANKINSTEVSFLAKELNSHIPKNIQIDIIPTIDLLKNPTVREVVQELDGKVLLGSNF
jgi:phosphate acetyltransferase